MSPQGPRWMWWGYGWFIDLLQERVYAGRRDIRQRCCDRSPQDVSISGYLPVESPAITLLSRRGTASGMCPLEQENVINRLVNWLRRAGFLSFGGTDEPDHRMILGPKCITSLGVNGFVSLLSDLTVYQASGVRWLPSTAYLVVQRSPLKGDPFKQRFLSGHWTGRRVCEK